MINKDGFAECYHYTNRKYCGKLAERLFTCEHGSFAKCNTHSFEHEKTLKNDVACIFKIEPIPAHNFKKLLPGTWRSRLYGFIYYFKKLLGFYRKKKEKYE